MKDYENVISDYIDAHRITKENCNSVLQDVGYVNFFNDITIACLGKQKSFINKETTNYICYYLFT